MSVTKMTKDFLVSTADVAFFYDDILAFTGKTSLNASISVSMEEEQIQGGKQNKLLYVYKYGRAMEVTVEMAEWKLAFIAANVGTTIVEGLKDVYSVAECVTLSEGLGTLNKTPVGDVFVEDVDGNIYTITPDGNTITMEDTTLTKVYATYQYNTTVKRVTIDADSSPFVGKLVLSADKHNNAKGKVGEIQIEIPSYQLSGNFDISLESTGVTSLEISGNALAVDGNSCDDGEVYAYITEIPSEESTVSAAYIAATPSTVSLSAGGTQTITVIGVKGGIYANISIDVADCTFSSDDSAVATVDEDGVITAVATGETIINVTYGDLTDYVKVVVS